MNSNNIKGSCLCGEVKYEISSHLGLFQNCHCSRCRKFTGSAYASNLFVKKEHFKWLSGDELVVVYEPVETKYFTTSFCKQCGSSLPWPEKSGRSMIIPAGTLDDDPDIKPQWNIFVASKAPWHDNTSKLPDHDELPARK